MQSRGGEVSTSIMSTLTDRPRTSSNRYHKPRCTRQLFAEQLENRRLFNVDWRNPAWSLDVNQDNLVTPLDALIIIDDLNTRRARPLPDSYESGRPYVDTNGDQSVSPVDVLHVISHLNAFGTASQVLTEQGRFDSERNIVITIGTQPGTSRLYRLELEASFGTVVSRSLVPDLFSVYLVNELNATDTLLDRGTNGTSLFAMSSRGVESATGLVRWDGSTLEMDLSSIQNLDTARLKLQLLNGDPSNVSRVTVRSVQNATYTDRATSQLVESDKVVQSPGAALNLASFTSSSLVEAFVNNVRFEPISGEFVASVGVRNSANSIGRNVALVIPGLPSGVTLVNASGTDNAGVPYLNLHDAIPSGGLGRNRQSELVELRIANSSRTAMQIQPEVRIGAPNRAPVLNSVSNQTASVGSKLDVTLVANDLDGDPLVYSVRSPSGVSIPTHTLDAATGMLQFAPQPDQLGDFQIEVLASDGRLSASQIFSLTVQGGLLSATRVSGKVLDADATPLPGIKVEIGGVQALTQSDGAFQLNVGDGPLVTDTLKVRGEQFSDPLRPTVKYPFIAEKLPFLFGREMYRGYDNVLDRPIYLPKLNVGSPVNPTIDTTIEANIRSGQAPVEVFIKAGSLLDQQGAPFSGNLSITEVPVDRTPAALPGNSFPDLLVTIQPGEMVFSTPAPITFPNTAGWAPGVQMDLWSINPVTGEFEVVGKMVVSADGKLIETVSGGIRNSSWHFPEPPPPPTPDNPNDDDDECDECEADGPAASRVTLHSGSLLETHDLVTYQSLGESRGISLVYDSLRADPRPIVHTGIENVDALALGGTIADQLRLVAELRIQRGTQSVKVPGYVGTDFGLDGGENFWKLPAEAGPIDAALQVDMRSLPTGAYDYVLSSGIRLFSPVQQRFVGSASRSTGQVLNVNSIASPFGSGWGIDGLQQVVENPDGSLMMVDGDGSELLFQVDLQQNIADYLLPDLASDSVLRYDGRTGALKGRFVLSGAGGLDEPHNPTFGPDGNLYVFSKAGNVANSKILRFDGVTGAFMDVFVNGGFGNGIQLAFGQNGNLYVSTQSADVFKFDGITGDALGKAATGNGIQRACGISIGPDGNLYVGDSDAFANTGYDRVLRFDPDTGAFIDVFVKPGRLDDTCPIDFGADGHLYIADHRTRDIREFDGQTGEFRRAFSAPEFGTPFRASSGPDGNLYVGAGTNPGKIFKVDGITGKLISTFVGNNTGFGAFFPAPTTIATRRVQDLLIQDANGDSILRYDGITGDLIGPMVSRGSGGLDQPHNPTFGPDGNLYVFSSNPARILRFDGQTGFFIDVFVDTGEGGFNGGAKIEFGPNGHLYVASGNRVLHYDLNGNFVGVAASSGLDVPCGVQFGPDGNLYVYDTLDEEMRRYDPTTGDLIDLFIPSSVNLTNACDFDIKPNGDILITDATLGGVRRFKGLDGSFAGVFAVTGAGASGVVIGPDDDLYVNVNGNVDRFDGDTGAFVERFVAGNGGFVNFFPAPAPLPVATSYTSPGGDYSTFEKLADGTYRRTTLDKTIYEFDGAGRLIRMTDRNGNQTNWHYDSSGNLIRMVDPVGLTTNLAYTSGKLTSITDPANRVTRFEIDASGNLLSITDPDGSKRSFEYDSDHRMTGETDKRGNKEQEFYDFAGRVDYVVRKNGAIIDVSPTQVRGLAPHGSTFDPFDAPVAAGDLTGNSTYIDANGNSTITTLDSLGQANTLKDPIGSLASNEYDQGTNRISARTDARGNQTRYTYDSSGNLLTSADAINPQNPVQTEYEAVFNQITKITNELGKQTLFDIDPNNGNTLSITRVIGTLGGGDDIVTQMTYTEGGRLDILTEPLGIVSDYDYNALGRLSRIRNAVGTVDESSQQFDYDNAGNMSSVIDENGHRTQYQYDVMNRITKIISPDPDGPGPLVSPITQFIYDVAGNLIKAIDASGSATQFSYDALNRQSGVIDALGQVTVFEADNTDNLRTAIDPLSQENLLNYDTRNRLVEFVDPLGGRTRYEYDLDDNLSAIADPLNNITRYEYDARGRLVRVIDPLNREAIYTYDMTDNLVSKTDQLGRVTTYSYDDVGRLISENWENGGNQIQFGYDMAGNLLSITDSFAALMFSYDSRGRLKTADNLGTPNTPHVVLSYTYDGVGKVLSMSDSINGVTQGLNSYQYDVYNRLVQLSQTGADVVSKQVNFSYTTSGQFEGIERFVDLGSGMQSVAKSTYAYDVLNRPTAISHAHASQTLAFFNYFYNAANRVTRVDNVEAATTYTYDSRNQLLAANHADPNNPDETYSYDANGNRKSSHVHDDDYVTNKNNQLASNGIFSYSYDSVGNLVRQTEIASGEVREFTWDFRNRLTSVVDKNGASNEIRRIVFTYDGLNRRISKNTVTGSESVSTHFVYDDANVLLEFVDNDDPSGPNLPTLAQRYLHGPAVDQVLAQEDGSGTVFWMLADRLGSITDLLDNSGTVVNHLKYDSYGNLISQSNPAATTRYRYTGREVDQETGLYYYRSRYFDSAVGRFLSQDPRSFGGSDVNLYRYVSNDPLNATDPSGEIFQYVVNDPNTTLAQQSANEVGNLQATINSEIKKKNAELKDLKTLFDELSKAKCPAEKAIILQKIAEKQAFIARLDAGILGLQIRKAAAELNLKNALAALRRICGFAINLNEIFPQQFNIGTQLGKLTDGR
jgi:RHS repeat-associated protein